MMIRRTQVLLWRTVACLALVVGAAGVLIPILPTVPFLIVAAWAGSKGWPSLEKRLLEHPVYGEHIRRWREKRIVPRRAKWLATLAMSMSAIALQFTSAMQWVQIWVPIVMFSVAAWLWTKPES